VSPLREDERTILKHADKRFKSLLVQYAASGYGSIDNLRRKKLQNIRGKTAMARASNTWMRHEHVQRLQIQRCNILASVGLLSY
jgi:hypothetical protein